MGHRLVTDRRGLIPRPETELLVETVLAEEDLLFSAYDFDEAFHHQLTQCQEMEAAEQLKEFKLWWDLLFRTLEPVACETQCSGCCA